MPLLEVTDLRIALATPNGLVQAVRGLDFSLDAGGTLGLIGESGCGKSLTALALMGLLPDGAQVSGSIRLAGQELIGLDERALCALRGNRMAMVFQEPMAALNPLHRVGDQVAEPLRIHQGLGRRQARQRAQALLERVGIDDAARRMSGYPHEFSGGQRQRICIAMALACGPALLIADEPTTALDTEVQAHILALLRELVAERGMALLLISHDLAVVAQNAARMLVMYGGSLVEAGDAAQVFARMAHPYTRGLLAARPVLGGAADTRAALRPPLPTIAGSVPPLHALPPGCPFAGRCAYTIAACHAALPPLADLGDGHGVRCIRPEAIAGAAP
ncbi:MAG: ABC transporter ATP-binding protein [Simplicispira sp.]|nr:ABC transporter ATP-binding protein [Simplicispira sp.]